MSTNLAAPRDETYQLHDKLVRAIEESGSGGGIPSGPAGGDLAGTYPNPTVQNISGSTGINSTISAIFAVLHAYLSDTIVGSGTSSISIGANCKWLTVRYAVLDGGGGYNYDIHLPVTDRTAGDKVEIVLDMPASSNPQIHIIEDDGTNVIWNEAGSGVAYIRPLFFSFNGTTWESDQ